MWLGDPVVEECMSGADSFELVHIRPDAAGTQYHVALTAKGLDWPQHRVRYDYNDRIRKELSVTIHFYTYTCVWRNSNDSSHHTDDS